jgi:hypothetical protein
MAHLAVEERGYPVPYFVAWIDGKPDFRVADAQKLIECVRFSKCWLCGGPLGRYQTYVIGPMCAVNRISSEPPSHLDCAEFSAKACPFLVKPKALRRDANIPESAQEPAGVALKRNPGVTLLWTTRGRLTPMRVDKGYLFRVGEPEGVQFFAEGRLATRAEVMESIESGYPLLEEGAKQEGDAAVKALAAQLAVAFALVDRTVAA